MGRLIGEKAIIRGTERTISGYKGKGDSFCVNYLDRRKESIIFQDIATESLFKEERVKKQFLTVIALMFVVVMIFGGAALAGDCSAKQASAPVPAEKKVEAVPATATVDNNESVMLKVSKMTCGSCVAQVAKALTGVAGVTDVKVSLEEGTAVVKCDPKVKVDPAMLTAAVVKIGYPTELATGNEAKTATGKMACDPAKCARTCGAAAAAACGTKK